MIDQRKIILALTLLWGVVAAAQLTYRATWYSADSNHLPQNSVKSIAKDKYGFIWLSTEGGLVRYDGENFKAFNTLNVPQLTSDRMYFFGGSVKSDSITVRNELGELCVIRNRNVKRLPADKKTNLRGIDSHLETIHALYYTEKGRKFRLASNNVTYIAGDGVITASSGSDSQTVSYPFKPGSRFFSLAGHLYHLKDDGSYIRFSGTRRTSGRLPLKLEPNFRLYLNIAMQQVFIASGKNVYRVDEKAGVPQMHLLYGAFDVRNNILAIYYDEVNNLLYLGSSNKGLQVVQQQLFGQMASTLKHVTGTDGVFYALTQYKGEVLAATGDVFDAGHFKGRLDVGRYSDKYMVVADGNNDLWLKAFRDLNYVTRASGYKSAGRWTMPNRVTALAKSPDGRVWSAVSNEGAQHHGGWLYVSDPLHGNPQPLLVCNLPDRPVTLCFVGNNEMWMGGRQGLYRVNLMEKKSYLIKGFKGVHVRNIKPDGKNIFVASYNKGLFLYDKRKVVHFPQDKNRYLLTTHCIIEDLKGFMWITTNSGLFRVLKRDLYAYANGTANTVYYYRYTKSDGFSTNEFNGGCEPCGVYLNKDIFLPSMDGIIYFDPSKINTPTPVNDIFIDDIQVDRTHVAVNDSVTLNRGFGRIRFYVSSPFYGDRYNQNIEVKLEGPVSQAWLPLTESNVSFSTLPPGSYTLTVRKMTGFGSRWQYKDFVFYIRPAFWQTWWFTMLMMVVAVFLILFIIRMRLNYIRYRNKLLENQIAEQTAQLHATISALRRTENDLKTQVANHRSLIKTVTHDIKSPLKFMSITGRYIYSELEKDPAALKEDVESIYTASSQLYNFVDNFLEYSKDAESGVTGEPFAIYSLAAEKIEFFRTIANSRGVKLVNQVPTSMLLSRNRHLVAIVLHNLLDNALKHTSNGSVAISATTNGPTTCIAVQDTGMGMTGDQVAYYKKLVQEPETSLSPGTGLGLHIIAELLAILQGSIDIVSYPGVGTTVTVCFSDHSL